MNEMLEQCRAMVEAMTGGDASSWMAGMMPMGGGMGIGMFLAELLWIALLVAIGVVVALFILRGRHPRIGAVAREVLDSRYARGEIDRDAYLRMRTDLADRAPTG
jgi:putative membrane protein